MTPLRDSESETAHVAQIPRLPTHQRHRWVRWTVLALALPVLYVFLDVFLGRFNGWSGKQWQFYSLSLLASGALWTVFFSVIRRLYVTRRGWALVIALSASAFYGVNIVLVYGYLVTVGLMPNYYTFEYLFDAPLNSWFLLRDSFTPIHGVAVVLASFAVFGILYRFWPWNRHNRTTMPGSRWVVIALLAVYLVIQAVLHNNVRFVDQSYSADMTTATSLLRNVTQRVGGRTLGRSGLLARMPLPLPEFPAAGLKCDDGRPVNVLFILTESLRADAFGMYGNPEPASPFLDSLVAANPQTAIRFERALSNTSTTLIAMPCLFTGLSPVQEAILVHTMPVFWEYFKALGYETFFMTSQSHEWYNIKSFFQIKAIDQTYNKENSGYEFVNDLGIDDRYVVDHFLEWLARRDTVRAFAGVIQVNSTHYPYWTPEDARPFGTDSLWAKYNNATRYMDAQIGRFIRGLQTSGTLDHTLIVLTSDHGEAFMEHGILGHRDGYYREFLHIPMLWIVPPHLDGEFRPTERIERMRTNASVNVSNLDIIPTLLDFYGIWDSPAFSQMRTNLPGQSLIGRVDATRPIIACNNNQISRYRTGLSLVMDDCHYILNLDPGSKRQEEIYWWTNDPGEKATAIDRLDTDTRRAIYQAFSPYPLCRGIFESCGISLPPRQGHPDRPSLP